MKTENYGQSLMDVGVGAFVISGGLVSKMTKISPSKTEEQSIRTELLRVVPIFILGAIRIVIVSMVNYQEHITEYGVHWNFFFTLACLSVITIIFERTLWKYIFEPKRQQNNQPIVLFVLGLFVLGIHQYRISFCGVEQW